MNAAENLTRLHEEAERDDFSSTERPAELALATRTNNALALISQNDLLSNFRQALTRVEDSSRR